jgi:hypothetical protein
LAVRDGTGATVGLDEHHLIRILSVDMVIFHI